MTRFPLDRISRWVILRVGRRMTILDTMTLFKIACSSLSEAKAKKSVLKKC